MAPPREKGKPASAQGPEAVGPHAARTHLSALVDRASAGEEIVIMRWGRPRALLVPLSNTAALRVRGRGAWRASADFDAPLPDDLLDAFDQPAQEET